MEMTMIKTLMISIVIVLITYLVYESYRTKKLLRNSESNMKILQSDYKSALVRFGNTFEQFVPFTSNFTQEEKNKFLFLGKPIDGVIFGEDKIKFVEVKTGSSQLNANQKRIKKMVEEGKIEFLEVRY